MQEKKMIEAALASKEDLKGRNLEGSWLTNLDFSGLDLTGCDFTSCNLFNSKFVGANLTNANFSGAFLEKANFTGAILDSVKTTWLTMDDGSVNFNVTKPEKPDMNTPIVLGDSAKMSVSDWERNRLTGCNTVPIAFGGSDMGVLLNKSTFKNPIQCIEEKQRMHLNVNPKRDMSVFDRGHRMEPYVAETFKRVMEENGHEVELITDTNMYQNPQHPFFVANLDYLAKVDGELCVLECKTCSSSRFEEVKRLKQGITCDQYNLQVNGYLSIAHMLGIEKAYICTMYGVDETDVAIVPIARNEAFEKTLMDTMDSIMLSALREEKVPIDGTTAQKALAAWYHQRFAVSYDDIKEEAPMTLRKEVALAPLTQISVLNEQIEEAEKNLSLLKEQLEVQTNVLREMLGESTKAMLNVTSDTYFFIEKKVPQQRSRVIDYEGIKNEYPDMYNNYLVKAVDEKTSKRLNTLLISGSISDEDYGKEMRANIVEVFDQKKFEKDFKTTGGLKAPFQRFSKFKPSEAEGAVDTITVTLRIRQS